MKWIYLTYLLGLFYYAANQNKVVNKDAFRLAWIWFAIIPVSHFFFALLRAANHQSARDLRLVEIWADGIPPLLFGISLFMMLGALGINEPKDSKAGIQNP